MYRTLIKPVVTYGTETWTLRKMDENSPIIFERKVLGKISSQRKDLWRMENSKKHRTKRNISKVRVLWKTLQRNDSSGQNKYGVRKVRY